MAKIEMYTTPFCGYCARAKNLLEKKGAAYEEVDVMMDEKKRSEMRERAKRSTVRQIFINGQYMRGTDAWFLVGSIHVRVPGEEQIRNRSYLIDSSGGIVASYDKIHMFDVQLAGGESYRESSTFKPGEKSVLAETPWGVLGMTICYDLRFPYLYRDLAHAGATMLSIPSSFTVPTGQAHWHVLMRARAIETGCFVFAPAQVGTHKGSNRKTYGHSVAVAPWGEVLADAGGEKAGFVIADVDLGKVADARKMVPSLTHDRKYTPPVLHKAAIAKAAE